MANSHRTFDVALWSARADRARARHAALQFRRSGWRVRLCAGEQPSPAADARLSLALVAGRPPAEPVPGVIALPSIGPHLITWLSSAARAAETMVDPHAPLGVQHLRRSTIASYDAIAEQFAEQWFAHPPMRELEHFLQRLRPRSRVLDAGCGPGHHAALVARAGHDVVGVDLSEGMLRQCKLRAGGIQTARMSLQALTFRGAAFDAIWCAAAILHVPREQLPCVLGGFLRVLRPGGLLGLNFQVGRRSEIVQRGQDRRFFEYYADAAEVACQLEAAGFAVESALHGQTGRNTHALDLTLNWSTLYASVRDGLNGRVGAQDRQAQVEFGLRPGEEVHRLQP